MSLDLDTRQRAMLQELGVRVWWPENATENIAVHAVPTVIKAANALKPPTAAGAAAAAPGGPAGLVGDVAAMDWTLLAQTIAACQACPLGSGRRAAVFAVTDSPSRADWLVLGEPPDDAEERAGRPFAAQAGQLLDNMLKAVGVSRRRADSSGSEVTRPEKTAYVTNVVKCRPAVTRNPTQQELATCENFLRREVALVQPKVILALGRYAAQALLQGSTPDLATTPLGKLRGQIHAYQGIPVIVSYPLSYLLRSPQEKARAWLDLCRAQELLRRTPEPA